MYVIFMSFVDEIGRFFAFYHIVVHE